MYRILIFFREEKNILKKLCFLLSSTPDVGSSRYCSQSKSIWSLLPFEIRYIFLDLNFEQNATPSGYLSSILHYWGHAIVCEFAFNQVDILVWLCLEKVENV